MKQFIKNNILKNWKQIVFIIATISIIFINLLNITDCDYWSDECFSIKLARMNVIEMVQKTAQDVHPPLYYLILRISYLIFGEHSYTWILPSVIPVLILIVFSATTINKKYGKKVSLLFMILISFLECCLRYNIEVRMYSWVNCFVTLSFWYACMLISSKTEKNKKNWILFTIFGILAAYTHYYALVTIAIMYVITFILLIIKNKKNLWKCLICVGVCIITYLPWLAVFLSQFTKVTGSFWITEIPSFLDCMQFIFGTNKFGKIVFGLFVLSLVLIIIRHYIKIKKDNITSNKLKIFKEIIKNEEVQQFILVLATVILTIVARNNGIIHY